METVMGISIAELVLVIITASAVSIAGVLLYIGRRQSQTENAK